MSYSWWNGLYNNKWNTCVDNELLCSSNTYKVIKVKAINEKIDKFHFVSVLDSGAALLFVRDSLVAIWLLYKVSIIIILTLLHSVDCSTATSATATQYKNHREIRQAGYLLFIQYYCINLAKWFGNQHNRKLIVQAP